VVRLLAEEFLSIDLYQGSIFSRNFGVASGRGFVLQ
jgi:hypothetical protein